MEPITTTALIAGTVALGKKALSKAAEKIGEAAGSGAVGYWGKVKGLLGIKSDPPPEQLEDAVGAAIYARPEVRDALARLLEEHSQISGSPMIGSIHVNKGSATVVGNNSGTINNTNNFNED